MMASAIAPDPTKAPVVMLMLVFEGAVALLPVPVLLPPVAGLVEADGLLVALPGVGLDDTLRALSLLPPPPQATINSDSAAAVNGVRREIRALASGFITEPRCVSWIQRQGDHQRSDRDKDIWMLTALRGR